MPDDFTHQRGTSTPWGLMTGSQALQLLEELHIDVASKVVAFYHKVFLLYPKLIKPKCNH